QVQAKTGFQIVLVDALGPAVTELLLQGSSGEVEPALVEECATGIDAGHPHQDGRAIGKCSEAFVDQVHADAPSNWPLTSMSDKDFRILPVRLLVTLMGIGSPGRTIQ